MDVLDPRCRAQPLQELAAAALALDQRDVGVGQGDRERHAGKASTAAEINYSPGVLKNIQLEGRQRIREVELRRTIRLTDRGWRVLVARERREHRVKSASLSAAQPPRECFTGNTRRRHRAQAA